MRDAALVRRMLDGDKGAAELWVAQTYPGLERMLWSLARDPDVAQDLVQQTYVKAWSALDTYRGEARLTTWLHRIAYHEYAHWLRDRRPTVPLADIADLPDPHLFADLKTVMLARSLAELPCDLRDTFLMFHSGCLSLKEVASVLQIPVGTVKSRLFSARRLLREMLAEPAAVAEPADVAPSAIRAAGRSTL